MALCTAARAKFGIGTYRTSKYGAKTSIPESLAMRKMKNPFGTTEVVP